MVNQSRLKSVRYAPVYQFGIQVPRNVTEAFKLDEQHGNTKWSDAIKLEMQSLMDYHTFKDMGKGVAPDGYKKIKGHVIFAVKHDLRHKARYVAGGHLTDPPIDSVYSGVVSLRSLRLVLLLAELNGLEIMAADVGNAYLEAKTKEKVYIIAGPEFRFLGLEGHTLIIYKALYGLRSSGARWHDRMADTLRDEGFFPSKADPDVWMRENDGVWEYICVYVDDLAAAMKNPKKFYDRLMSDHGFKLKGVGPISYHLGADFGRDPDGTLYYGPQKYIKKMMTIYEDLFGEKPKEYTSPMEKGDHPEVDVTPELDSEGITIYQSLIGCLQWLVTNGRFDVAQAVMVLSRFRAAPREGHLARVKRVFGYARKFPHAVIRVRTGIPDYSDLPTQTHDWMYSVYGPVKEELPPDMPKPLGKPVVTTTYEDANLYHCLMTGRSATGILHIVNQTPIDWFSKRQATVETATYGSEFIAARIATEQIIDLRYTLRMLGAPIQGPAYMFGDNQSVLTNSTLPHSTLSKRHNALSYHRVREAIAAGFIRFHYIAGTDNPADILTKALGFQQFWPLIKPLLFWRGDTATSLPGKGE